MSKNNVKELLKTYIVDADGSAEIDTEAFVHTVGYVKDGKITDFLYDSFIFLPQPNYLYDYAPGGTGGRKPMNKAEWTDYIENEEFKSGMNVNALNEATGIVKKELGISDYKSHVFLSIFYPHNDMHEFGEVDGENLDLLDVENKKKALKWMVDKSIEEFNKRNYEHIDLGGFYWFYESIAMKPEEHNEEPTISGVSVILLFGRLGMERPEMKLGKNTALIWQVNRLIISPNTKIGQIRAVRIDCQDFLPKSKNSAVAPKLKWQILLREALKLLMIIMPKVQRQVG